MDYLVKKKDMVQYTNDFNYATNFFGDSLFTRDKSENFIIAMRKLAKNGNLPVMAQFHALDTEARIGDRTNYREIEVEKLFIKEKINQTESIDRLLRGAAASDSEILGFIFDDAGNLISRVLTRMELANMQLLSTGKISIDENNFKTVVDFGFDESENKVDMTGWSDPSHDILGDIETLKQKAKKAGKTLTMAVTSEKILGYMFNNTAIKKYFEKSVSTELYTTEWVIRWLEAQTGILFATNEDVYKTAANETTTHRFFPENCISWLATPRGEAFGVDLYGITPEESMLRGENLQTTGFVVVTQWKTPDPVATWTKASGLGLPVPRDIDSLYISKVSD